MCQCVAHAQMSRLAENVEYSATLEGTAGGGDNAPFWFTNNRYGLGAIDNYTAMARAELHRNAEADSLRFWRMGYGVDIVGAYGRQSYFNLQQAYLDVQWKMLGLSLGQKERSSEFKNPFLSSGGLTLGQNARPIPQVRLELPDFWAIPGTKGFFSIKAHIAYGWYTDNVWQKDFNNGTSNIYTANSWFHSKALFLKFGNKEKFPLEFAFGIEMACQFAGRGYNIKPYNGTELLQDAKLGGNMWTAFLPGGGDINDDVFQNASGNHVGSWHFRLDWKKEKWNAGVYVEHFFDDHSQMFFQYGMWKDMLVGVEVNLPKNPYLTTLVYEHNGTKNQSGPLLHDATPENPLQISACDDYYNHHIYGAWQHGGYVLGNPTLISPLYNNSLGYEGSINVYHNRINAHHIGLTGNPTDEITWRILYTHETSLGTYYKPVLDPEYANFLLLETSYAPKRLNGLKFKVSYGHNDGSILGKSNAGMLTISYSGWINMM